MAQVFSHYYWGNLTSHNSRSCKLAPYPRGVEWGEEKGVGGGVERRSNPINSMLKQRRCWSKSFFFLLNHSYLNGFGPLQIGGVENTLNDANINYGGFEGCIRNIYDNHVMYDLENPLLEKNTELGCKLENNPCPDCNDNGYCEPLWTNSICVCDLGYSGPNCNSSKRFWSCYREIYQSSVLWFLY